MRNPSMLAAVVVYVLVTVLDLSAVVTSFLIPSPHNRPPHPSLLRATDKELSDVDARVLQSMLNENKLNENDVRRIMVQSDKQKKQKGQQQQADNSAPPPPESEYSSQFVQKFTETKLFQKLSVQATEWLESTKILVLNKVEQDLQVVLGLTSTVWDRASRNVARALPATSTANSTSTRVLRSAAPAGRAAAAERQKRAYTASKQTKRKKIPNVVDSAYQVRRELQAETSVPGYKSEPARKAIAAAAVSAYRLAGLKTPQQLEAAKQQRVLPTDATLGDTNLHESVEEMSSHPFVEEPEIMQTSSDEQDFVDVKGTAPTVDAPPMFSSDDIIVEASSTIVDVVSDTSSVVDEIHDDAFQCDPVISDNILRQRLDECIQDPYGTWLTEDVMDKLPSVDYCAQEAISILLTARNGLDDTSETISQHLSQACNDASGRVSRAVGNQIQLTLFRAELVANPVVDIIADAFVESYVPTQLADDEVSVSTTFMAEVITEEEFEGNQSPPKTALEDMDENSVEEENVLSKLALRSLDVLFLVFEKLVVVAVPNTIQMGQTALKRIEGVRRQGQGSDGWTPVTTVKGRY